MKFLFALFSLGLSTLALALPTTSVCRIQKVSPQAIPRLQFSTNVIVQTDSCGTRFQKAFLTAPEAAKADLENALRDGTAVSIETTEPIVYGGTVTAVNGRHVGPLDTVETAQFYVMRRSEDHRSVKTEARRLLDLHHVKRKARTDVSHGKTFKTWDRSFEIAISDDLSISFDEDAGHLSYGAVHPPSSSIRAEYLKSARDDSGRTLGFEESARVLRTLGTQLPYSISGERLSSGKFARITFSMTPAGLVQVTTSEVQ